MLVTHPATAFRPVRSPAFAVTSRKLSGLSVMAILQPSATSPPWPLASQGESRLLMPSHLQTGEDLPVSAQGAQAPATLCASQTADVVALGITPRWGGDCFEGRARLDTGCELGRCMHPSITENGFASRARLHIPACPSTPPPIKALPAPGVGAENLDWCHLKKCSYGSNSAAFMPCGTQK